MSTVSAMPSSHTQPELLARLDKKMKSVLAEVEASEVYRAIMDPKAGRLLISTVIRNIMLEIVGYQPIVTEAIFTAVGRAPKTDEEFIRSLIAVQIEEAPHAELALRDYVRLGGSEKAARQGPMSPCAFAVAAVCRVLGEREHWASWLGYMYLFEVLTPILAYRMQRRLTGEVFPNAAREFIDLHAEEDIRHADMIGNLIAEVVEKYPDAATAIEYGFNCFASVYPMPLWNGAYARAVLEVAIQQ